MSTLPGFAVGASILAVAAVLALGLANMLRQGSGNRSQRLMRWRVGLQFAAIAVIAAVLLLRNRHG